MTDHLRLSLWLSAFEPLGLAVYFEKALQQFPFSRLKPNCILRVQALNLNEPPLLEVAFDEPDLEEMRHRVTEFMHTDSAFEVEAQWDLWQWDGDWSLRPSTVLIDCCGPDFETDAGEHLVIDAGPESLYLPLPVYTDALRPVQSNVRSLLHLTADLEEYLPVDRKTLWSDSGENFAERFEELLKK
jgi:hypothetical protein